VNDALPKIESIETYEVRADGELLTSEQADVLPLAQGKLLFRRDQGSGIRAGD
jgi:urease alpha subunit